MKINSIQFYKNFNTNFCANKKNYYDVLQSANPKDYPVRVYDEIKKCAQENETLNFYDLNYRLYSPLLKAKNLDEAKALYSEFENILELSQAAKSVPFKDPKIQAMIKGKINEPEGGFSLHILKCLYKLEKDDDYSGDKLRRTAKSLRIPDVGKRYFSRVTFDSPSHKEKMSLSHSGDEYIKNLRKNARER